jgi:hypothetical protein
MHLLMNGQLVIFPADSIMVKFINQQQWSTLEHVVSVGFEEVGKFFTVRDYGIPFEDIPMSIHLRRFKAFQLCYRSKTCWGEGPTEDAVMCWMTQDLMAYCFSKAYHDDYAEACPTSPLKPSQRAGIYNNFRGTRNGGGCSSMAFPVILHKFHQGVRQDKTVYHAENDEKGLMNGMKMFLQSLK